MATGPWNTTTLHGYRLDEAASALQKAIRRSQVEGACFWAFEMTISGYGGYCWRRLIVISSEDVGMADPQVAVLVNALYQMSVVLRPHEKAVTGAKGKIWPALQVVHAAWALAKAPKNREVCDLIGTVVLRMQRNQLLEIPDHARDQFTASGRRLGRGEIHFNAEGAKLEGNVAEVDGNVWHEAFCREWTPDEKNPSRKGIGGPTDDPS